MTEKAFLSDSSHVIGTVRIFGGHACIAKQTMINGMHTPSNLIKAGT